MNKTIEELLTEQTTPNKDKEQIVEEETISNVEVSQEENTKSENNQVVDLLKQSLNIHWQQTIVLTAQAAHLERWGYKKLAAVIKADANQEHEHALVNIARLEFFDTDYQPIAVQPPSWKRHDMVALIQYNLASVQEAAVAEKATIMAARAVGDEMTANIMIPLLQGSEDGISLYQGYLKLIEEMGLDNFLSVQV